jgi:murein DD-endopeptidase MepM/ murein hydrolase activator NlpD
MAMMEFKRELVAPHRHAPALRLLIALTLALVATAQPFRFPTANKALLEPGGGERFFAGTAGKPWTSGQFGCVRSEGTQFHEGLDIRSLQRDRAGEPTDPVRATADGTVAYINEKPGLSNYGRYVILRHSVEGIEIYSVYAHLRSILDTTKPGRTVHAGDQIAVLGRSTNTRQAIAKDRAHLHFELCLRLSDRFAAWHTARLPGQRNDHGEWNGRNFLGLDPAEVFREQAAQGHSFSLLRHLRNQKELCRVTVRARDFSWLSRYPLLIEANPKTPLATAAGYELFLNYNGVPYRAIPRSAAELKNAPKFQVTAVNEPERTAHPCRRLVRPTRDRWQLAQNGEQLLDLLTFKSP